MATLSQMWNSFLNLFSYSWEYLVSVFGLNILYTALFSIVIPILIFIVTAFHRSRQERENKITMVQIMKESFLTPKTIITGGIYILAWILLLSWGITYTTFKDHEDLKERIRMLIQEKIKYEEENSNKDKKISEQEEELKKMKLASDTKKESKITPTEPKPIFAGVRFTQRQIASTNPKLPYGLEVILQTDAPIDPVGFVIEFNREFDIKNVDVGFVTSGPISRENSIGREIGTLPGKPNTLLFRWSASPFTPEKNILVTIYSKNYIQAERLLRVK